MNKVFLIGNLTRDPESSTSPNGIPMCRFSIAVNRRFTAQDGANQTDYFNITTWRGLAENCGKYLSKGKKVAVCGSLQIRNYDANDGTKRTAVDITADDVEFLSSSKSDDGTTFVPNDEPAPAAPKKNKIDGLKPIEDADLPF